MSTKPRTPILKEPFKGTLSTAGSASDECRTQINVVQPQEGKGCLKGTGFMVRGRSVAAYRAWHLGLHWRFQEHTWLTSEPLQKPSLLMILWFI